MKIAKLIKQKKEINGSGEIDKAEENKKNMNEKNKNGEIDKTEEKNR